MSWGVTLSTGDSTAGSTSSASAGTIVIGSQQYYSNEIVAEAYAQALEDAGFKVDRQFNIGQRSVYLPELASGKIDAYFGPNPGVAYQNTQTAKSANPTRTAGTFSGAGESLQGLIAATTKKGNGLDKPLADAINYLIDNGQYAAILKAWQVQSGAITKSVINGG